MVRNSVPEESQYYERMAGCCIDANLRPIVTSWLSSMTSRSGATTRVTRRRRQGVQKMGRDYSEKNFLKKGTILERG